MQELLDRARPLCRLILRREEKQQIAIGDLLAKIVDGFRLRESERVRFEMALPDDPAAEPVIVEASEERLIQVFENVLDNAVSFSPRRSGLKRMTMTIAMATRPPTRAKA